LLADLLVVVHAAYVVFVVVGGFLAWRWRTVAWWHVPAAAWGVAVELAGWSCPLTPLENALRARAGGAGYHGGFIEHYVEPLLYPVGLTVPHQIVLGCFALAVNLVAYGVLVRRHRRRRAGLT
jgi:hypothetical protein